MRLQNAEVQQNLTVRLKRIEGQVHGIEAMIKNQRECREILQQLIAVRSALQGATTSFVQEYMTYCLLGQEGEQDKGQLIKELVDMLGKAS